MTLISFHKKRSADLIQRSQIKSSGAFPQTQIKRSFLTSFLELPLSTSKQTLQHSI